VSVPAGPVVLTVDVGGSHVKVLLAGESKARRFESGPNLTAQEMVDGVAAAAAGWSWDVVTIGIPTPVRGNQAINEPANLGKGWVGFDYAAAFGAPTKLLNDAAMQAVGSYEGGRMLFLGLGTGLGSALVVERIVVPLEFAHFPFRKSTLEEHVGERALIRCGKKKWRRTVFEVVDHLTAAMEPDYVVLGGGGITELDELPPRCRRGKNANAFLGGFRLWEPDWSAAGQLP
jgi:polyphosphate glucokinase